jgi:hypothetical protein
MKNILIAVALLLLCPAAFSQEAPKKSDRSILGLEFGDSYRSVSKRVNLVKGRDSSPFVSYSTDKVPKGLSDAALYMLLFYKGTLVKVMVLGEPFTNDYYGAEGKATYAKYKSLLSKKYALENSYERSGSYLYDDPSEFWECLGYKEGTCGMYATTFNGDDRSVSLQLKSSGRDGYYVLSFESNLFVDALEEYQAEQKKSDSEGL